VGYISNLRILIIFGFDNRLMEGGKVNFEKETGEGLAKNAFLIKRLSVTPNSPSVEVDFSPLQGHLSSQQDGDK
jgi:hypothetical protein